MSTPKKPRTAIADAGAGTPDAEAGRPKEPPSAEELIELKRAGRNLLTRLALLNPFPSESVKWLPGNVKGNRCLAMPYIDARLVMDRLDEVIGVGNWCDEYEFSSNGCAICKLTVKMPGTGDAVTKCDVGSPSEQPDAGDKLKAAVSDALKRTAVKFGIGRYLYRIPPQWVDYDPVKKQIIRRPVLPASALPRLKDPAPVTYHDHDEADTGDEPRHEPPKEKEPVREPESKAQDLYRIPPQWMAQASKPADVPEQKVDEKAVTAQRCKDWMVKLTACDKPEDLNAMLPLLAKEPAFAKGAVWKLICSTVKDDPVNWEYDATKKKFYDARSGEGVGESIPF